MQALFGQAWVTDESWSNDGRVTKRRVERPRVSIDEWMNALEPGDAWLRVAPIDRGWRQERVRAALPRQSDEATFSRSTVSVSSSVTMSIPDRAALTEPDVTESGGSYGMDIPPRGP